jgi:hypothetical protein
MIKVIKSRTIKWMGHAVGKGEMGHACKISNSKLKGRDHLGDLGADIRSILKLMFN